MGLGLDGLGEFFRRRRRRRRRRRPPPGLKITKNDFRAFLAPYKRSGRADDGILHNFSRRIFLVSQD